MTGWQWVAVIVCGWSAVAVALAPTVGRFLARRSGGS